jgi:hypothetical protein
MASEAGAKPLPAVPVSNPSHGESNKEDEFCACRFDDITNKKQQVTVKLRRVRALQNIIVPSFIV